MTSDQPSTILVVDNKILDLDQIEGEYCDAHVPGLKPGTPSNRMRTLGIENVGVARTRS